MSMYEPLELPARPPMESRHYLDSVQRAADELRRAQPWLLVPYGATARGDVERLVARRRTLVMAVVTWCINLWRRPMRWYLGRLEAARIVRASRTPNRNGG